MPSTTPANEYQTRFEQEFQPSNHIFPEDDQDITRELMSESQRNLGCLNGEVVGCGAASQALAIRREKEDARMQRLRTGVAPHERMPLEVLSLIFVSTLDDTPTHIAHGPFTCPWNITQVCLRWRVAALSDPRLWRTMAFSVSSKAGVHTIPPQAHSFLEHLSVTADMLSTPRVESMLAPFAGCRNLRGIKLETFLGFSLIDLDFLYSFPWKQLTALEIPLGCWGLALDAFLGILRCSPNLGSITVEINSLTPPTNPRTIELPSLRSLAIHIDKNGTSHPNSTNTLLACLTLPAVETVTISRLARRHPTTTLGVHTPPDEAAFLHGLYSLAARSRCRIKHLAITGFCIPAPDVSHCLATFPDLVSCNLGAKASEEVDVMNDGLGLRNIWDAVF